MQYCRPKRPLSTTVFCVVGGLTPRCAVIIRVVVLPVLAGACAICTKGSQALLERHGSIRNR